MIDILQQKVKEDEDMIEEYPTDEDAAEEENTDETEE